MFAEECKALLVLFIFLVLSETPCALALMCQSTCGVPSSWLPVAQNVCYGTTHDSFGTFTINRDCKLVAIRLSHVSGYQSFNKADKRHRSRWGYHADHPTRFCTLILKDNKVWLPEVVEKTYGYYPLNGFGPNDDVIVFKKNETLAVGSKFQVGFCRDYTNVDGDNTNEGTPCVDVDISCLV